MTGLLSGAITIILLWKYVRGIGLRTGVGTFCGGISSDVIVETA